MEPVSSMWPEYSPIPDEWSDTSGHHEAVVAILSEGHCPMHHAALRPDGYCSACGVSWTLSSTEGTLSTSAWAPWAVTDGQTVLIARHLPPLGD
jgi:hypothetical protein